MVLATLCLSIKKLETEAQSWLLSPLYFQTRRKKQEDLILFLLLQGYCSFKSFWLLSSECPCAPLMGLIWYSALMPSLIFVCETKCFDGGWLLKRLCVCLPKAGFFFFFFFLFFLFFGGVRVLWPLTVQYTLCLLLKTRTQSIEFWIRFIIPPSSQQLCCQWAACVCLCLRERGREREKKRERERERCECLLCLRDLCVCVWVCVCACGKSQLLQKAAN